MSVLTNPQGEIVAAVKLDAQAPAILATAANLCRMSGRSLRLIHVHSADYPAYANAFHEIRGLMPLGLDDFSIERETLALTVETEGTKMRADIFDTDLDLTERWLRELGKTLVPRHVSTRTSVLVGNFPDTLIEHTTKGCTSLVVVGAARKRPGLMHAKVRQTYRLMARSAVPVLVLPDAGAPLAFGKGSLRMLLADDLTPDSVPALEAAAALTELAGQPCEVLHIHVEPLASGSVALSPDFELEIWPAPALQERLSRDWRAGFERQLASRGRCLRGKTLVRGGRYTTQLWHGAVAEEIARAAAAHAADIVIFGAHHFLHRHRLTLGHMSFAAMLEVGSAILVAPR